MLKIIKILILFSSLFITACGYHLRGSVDLPESLNKIYFQGASSHLKKSARKALRSSDAVLVKQSEIASMVVQIDKEKMDRKYLSLSPTGRATEYELIYTLDYTLIDAKGNQIAESQQIKIIKDYFNDQEDILAKNREEQVIRQEIYRQAAQTIFNRARFMLKKD